jgi:3-phenylpropionate/trans-cinnamate dioxygenase ferredoxin subunit
MAYQTVCRADDIEVGTKKAFKVGSESVLVYRLEDGYYATQANCTHLFAPLLKGKIVEGCRIQCPFHRAQFDIRTGEVAKWANFPPGVQLLNVVRGEKALKTWKVRVEGGNVQLDL